MSENTSKNEFLSLVDVYDEQSRYKDDITDDLYFGFPLKPIITAEKQLRNQCAKSVAYFSMEYGLASSFYNQFKTDRAIDPQNKYHEQEVFSNSRLSDYFFTIKINSIIDLPIYSGGLGVLAGDTVKTMADYKLCAVAVGMLWNSGYFKQKFWFKYGQMPEKMQWDLYSYPGLIPLKQKVKIQLNGQDIFLRLWKYYVYSYRKDYVVPLILLDSNLPENNEYNRHLTDQLYKSDNISTKALQRLILGMGGVAALKELGYCIDIYHMNEGHAVFAFIEKCRGLNRSEKDELKKHFVYTCHTPVEAGHDRFNRDDLARIIKREDMDTIEEYGREKSGMINLTLLAMNVSSMVNSVSLNHQKVMHIQFPHYKDKIQYVTNGVHPVTWMSDSFVKVFDEYKSVFGDIRKNPMALVKAQELRSDSEFRKKIWLAHQANKHEFCSLLSKWQLSENVFTICWARRVAAYKRPSLILKDTEKLVELSRKIGPIQVIFAGKAHPNDDLGFTYINQMLDKVDSLSGVFDSLKIVMLENYEMALARHLTSSVDVWLNNPLPPFEASGTSGMKAILNGVVQISTYDGWVVEAAEKNIGRIFGYRNAEGTIGNELDLHMDDDARQLYATLDDMVSLYYATNKKNSVDLNSRWIDFMIDCLAAGAYFNTYRMADDYKRQIWEPVWKKTDVSSMAKVG